MGEEMTEMMSEEISRVMTEQKNLEDQYAHLVRQRSELKGLSNKSKLQDVHTEIKDVASKLKESTRILVRVLQDNPDVDGNQKKIKLDKVNLISTIENLMSDMKDLSYANFKGKIKQGIEEQGLYDRLRLQV